MSVAGDAVAPDSVASQPGAEFVTGQDSPAVMLKIGQAARIVGVSTSRIRLWESERLITPHRTPSGQRLFTMRDVKRLEKIRRLLESGSMTMVGVRKALDDKHDEAPAADADAASTALGARVKALRLSNRMSLRDLSREIAISPSALSAFERGQSKPSIGRITQIAHALGTTTPELLGVPAAEDRMVVRADSRKELPLAVEGVTIENLYQTSTVLQSQMVTIEPGYGSGEPMTHAGEEFLTVVEGEVEIVLDGIETILLATGDSMTFASTRPHTYANRGMVTARVVWVNTPPTF
ncbi:MerR family transcriptional regulator [Rhodococcus sp. D-6]|uniref:MerR family transcriptional regulator n=1 Tax=Rhodococcus sp. D-6 TaxID=1387842 RepID=A0AAU7UT67_9NOCA|nr:MerR family transcriptional regulator [Rhodococcus sp. HS-D2]